MFIDIRGEKVATGRVSWRRERRQLQPHTLKTKTRVGLLFLKTQEKGIYIYNLIRFITIIHLS